jgi:hypothetical protein
MFTRPVDPLIDFASGPAPQMAMVVPVIDPGLSFSTTDGVSRVSASSVPTIEAIRAARVRHFQGRPLPSVPVRSVSTSVPVSSVEKRYIGPSCIIPPGVDCVDLTDD